MLGFLFYFYIRYAYNNINIIGIVVFELSEIQLLEFELSEFELSEFQLSEFESSKFEQSCNHKIDLYTSMYLEKVKSIMKTILLLKMFTTFKFKQM